MNLGMLPLSGALQLNLPLARTKVGVQANKGTARINGTTGIQFIPSVVWTSKAFPEDLVQYEQALRTVAANLPVDKAPYIVIENEPNCNEENGDVQRYISMLKIALAVFGSKYEIYLGGLTYPALAAWVCSLYQQEGAKDKVQVFIDHHARHANEDNVAFIADLIAYINTNSLPVHFNFHCNIEEDVLATLPLVIEKIRNIYKGKIICGECSFNQQNPQWITDTLNIMKDLDAVVFYNGIGNGTAVVFTPEMENEVLAFTKEVPVLP